MAHRVKGFVTADDRPILLENPSKANSEAEKKLKAIKAVVEKDDSDILKDFVAGKRKRELELKPKKKARQASLNSSYVSSINTPVKTDDDDDEDELNWSGDEALMNQSISFLNDSIGVVDKTNGHVG